MWHLDRLPTFGMYTSWVSRPTPVAVGMNAGLNATT